jgi:hypothetical protein
MLVCALWAKPLARRGVKVQPKPSPSSDHASKLLSLDFSLVLAKSSVVFLLLTGRHLRVYLSGPCAAVTLDVSDSAAAFDNRLTGPAQHPIKASIPC